MPRAKKSRVLFVGGGRRVSLARAFQDAGASVYCYEASVDEPVADVCDEIHEGLDFDDPEFRLDVEQYAKKRKITHIVPLMDEATVLCGDMPGCIGSSSDVASLCHDKLHFGAWMRKNCPDLYPSPSRFRYPKFAKPRFGRSSRGVKVLNNPSTLELSLSWVIQDYLDGQEVSVDTWVAAGKCVGGVARSRDRIEGGEVIESTVLDSGDSLLYLMDAARVCCDLGVVGPANVQFKGGKVIEVNARFGGGCVLSMAAGFDMVGLALGKKTAGPPWSIAAGMKMRRYHAESYR